MRDASLVLADESVDVVADGGLHLCGHEVVVDGLLLSHVGLVRMVHLLSEGLALRRACLIPLLGELLVDLLEVLLPCFDEVLLLCAGAAVLLAFMDRVGIRSGNLVAVLE